MGKPMQLPPQAALEAMIDAIPTQLWQMSYECTYGRVNAAHAAFLGKTREEIEQKPIESVLSQAEAAVAIAQTRNAFDSKRSFEADVWRVDAGGKQRLLRIVLTPTKDAEGNVMFLSCSADDITERWEAEREVQLCREGADEHAACRRHPWPTGWTRCRRRLRHVGWELRKSTASPSLVNSRPGSTSVTRRMPSMYSQPCRCSSTTDIDGFPHWSMR